MKALVFGGAFNPPTKAHIELPHHVMTELGYDCVIYVPSKMTYITDEQKKDYAFSDRTRISMLDTIAQSQKWMKVSSYELRSESQPRTYTTLCYLRDQGYTCSLLFGSDKLPELETGWLHVDEIMKEFGVVCMRRADDPVEQWLEEDPYLSQYREYITLIDTDPAFSRLSSTEVRNTLQAIHSEKERLKEIVPDELDGLSEYL
ncbi:MAG: hypothetical protein K6G61_10790 [Solobacterium sp.]|nr:hypothetical protein [Solobacterium sp.]